MSRPGTLDSCIKSSHDTLLATANHTQKSLNRYSPSGSFKIFLSPVSLGFYVLIGPRLKLPFRQYLRNEEWTKYVRIRFIPAHSIEITGPILHADVGHPAT